MRTDVTFEAAHQGVSEGEPHFLENPVQRAEDIKSAVSYLGTQQDVDPDHIGALDTPTGGGHAVVYATISDQPIGAVRTVSAACSGSPGATGSAAVRTRPSTAIPSPAPASCVRTRLSTSPSSSDTSCPRKPTRRRRTIAGRGTNTAAPHTMRTCGPRTRALRGVDQIGQYDSFANIGSLAPRPLLMIVGSEAATAHVSRMAVEQAGKSKELSWLDGASHCDLYGKDEHVSPALAQLTSFSGEHPTQPPVDGRAA
ncbi:alpha/beta hydrolase [Streptomyces europaeiscabiei]|uniref:alpha/beta hydrolase n=1 Tax=Streptomyces europaeiscabiei TaxID=146819 RepID=UPI000E69BB7D|nr:alpha/beta hydrolase [Streptomyces europaeiscabiei]